MAAPPSDAAVDALECRLGLTPAAAVGLGALARFRVLSLDDLAALPDPLWLVDGVLPVGAAAMLYGAPGDGKTFLALSLALAVASDGPWFGRQVLGGRVVYVAAEGLSSLKRRVAAWREVHAWMSEPPDIGFVGDAPQLLNRLDGLALRDAVLGAGDGPVALVVIDTLARSMAGGDENTVRDTSLAIATVDLLRHETGGAVLLVHHTQKAGELERGSGNWRAAMDVMLAIRFEDGAREVRCTKMKDGPEFTPFRFNLIPTGESCIVATESPTDEDRLTPRETEILTAIGRLTEPGGETATTNVWCKTTAIPERSFYLGAKRLRTLGLVETYNRGYRITLTGTARLQAHCKSTARPPGAATAITAGGLKDPRSCSAPLQSHLGHSEEQQERAAIEEEEGV